jgi:TonB family protein
MCFLGGLVGLSCGVAQSLAQNKVGPEAPQEGVVLTKLSEPVYPPLASQTRIAGDVHLTLKVRLDGSVESTTVVSGHPLLQQAAIESLQKSQFECRKCDEAASIELVYTFQIAGTESCCTPPENQAKNDHEDLPIPRVIQFQNHVTVIDRPACICDPSAVVTKVRSLKCLYLWKCKTLHFN